MNYQPFVQRRRECLAKMPCNSLAILPAAPPAMRNGGMEYRYRQDSDFYYLTGFTEPNAVLVLLKTQDHEQSMLFCQGRDPLQERWQGPRLGPERAKEQLHVDQAYAMGSIDDKLPEVFLHKTVLYYPINRYHAFEHKVRRWMKQAQAKKRASSHVPSSYGDIGMLLNEMRLIKSAEEIALMEKAADIAANAHIRAMQACPEAEYEYHIEAVLQEAFLYHGCRMPAYEPIVASGANACVLHYNDNQARLRRGDLLLIDAAGEYAYYAADVTRTFPISGRFSGQQKALYDIVLEAQLAGIAKAQAGNAWTAMQEVIVRVITEGLVDLKILQGDVDALIAGKHYQQVYMHNSGHWLGLDVHDVGDYYQHDQARLLVPNMVLTVEPGIYIAEDNQTVPAQWRGMGIRIEDDIVITEGDAKVLSAKAPKTPAEIEALMCGR